MTVSAEYPVGTFAAAEEADDGVCVPHDIEQITNHVEQGLSLLIEQYKNKPRIAAVLESALIQIQEVEDAIFSVLNATVYTATGDRLAKWGKLVGQTNPNLTDDNYRVLILARIAVNKSNAFPDEILNIIQLIASSIGITTPVITMVTGSASYSIDLLNDIGSIDPDVIVGLLDDADTVGVGLEFSFGRSPTDDLFRWSSSYNATQQYPDQGFDSSHTPGSGGLLSASRRTTT